VYDWFYSIPHILHKDEYPTTGEVISHRDIFSKYLWFRNKEVLVSQDKYTS